MASRHWFNLLDPQVCVNSKRRPAKVVFIFSSTESSCLKWKGLWTVGSGPVTTEAKPLRKFLKMRFQKGKICYVVLQARWETHKCKEFNPFWSMTTELPGTGHLPSHPRHRPGSAGLALFCTAPAWPGEGKGKKEEKVRTVKQAQFMHFSKWQFNRWLLDYYRCR